MKPLPQKNDTASVLGLGRSGRALILHLLSLGVQVYAFDDAPAERLGDTPAWLASLGVPLFAGGEGEIRGDFVFRSPAVRPDTPRLCRAALRGCITWGEAEYFAALCPCPIYGVTGSDGKTTTATMLARLLERDGRRVFLGGNIGRSLLPFLGEIRPTDACVLELSSFQLMDFSGHFHTGVVTNLTPNHLNWHTDFSEYAAAKRRLAEQSERRVLEKGLFPTLSALRFSVDGEADFTLKNGYVYALGVPLFAAHRLRLVGIHNLKNLLAAAAAASHALTPARLLDFARGFSGVSHRMERVGEKDGVIFVDSSIDTTPSRTAVTLTALGGRTRLLLGGRGKRLPLSPLADALRTVERAYLFGEMEEELAAYLKKQGVSYLPCGTMEAALLSAYAEAREGDTVLLSPGATAFDAFRDYEERGERFAQTVEELSDKK
jgi:UDP-N-acetylmuramoylalanine--D-glutamate ligase